MQKFYVMENVEDLDAVRQWVSDPDHHSQLVSKHQFPKTQWLLVVYDPPGLASCSEVAERELGSKIKSIPKPE